MSSQSTEAEDNIIVEDLRGRVFGPLEFSRRDLMAVNIQRARDHGLPDYNTARKHFGLEPLESLSVDEFKRKTNTMVPDVVLKNFVEVYESDPDSIDIWPGGLMETTNGPGQLFSAVIKNQFERIRDGDRFWFENKNSGLFTTREIKRIRQLKIIDIVLCVANITLEDIQQDPFTAPTVNNQPGHSDCYIGLTATNCTIYHPVSNTWNSSVCFYLPPPRSNTNLERCTDPQTYDYFSGSSVSFIATFSCIGALIAGLIFAVNFMVFRKKVEKRSKTLSQIEVKDGEFKCKERVGFFESRVVVVCFDAANVQILVKDSKDKVLRVLELLHLDSITVFYTVDLRRIMVRANNHYDLYLKINDERVGQQMKDYLAHFCEWTGKECAFILREKEFLRNNVTTSKHREESLKKVLDSILDIQKGSDVETIRKNLEKKHKDVTKINMTKAELANALGMSTDNSSFQQFYYIMDKDQNGFVTFDEFLKVLIVITNGTEEERVRLFFDLYDHNHSGDLTAEDFRAFIESANPEQKGETVEEILSSMLQMVGLLPGDTMSFEKFQELFKTRGVASFLVDGNKLFSSKPQHFSLYEVPGEETEPDDALAHEHVEVEETTTTESKWKEYVVRLSNYVKSNEKYIFWMTSYTFVMFLIFAERAYYFSVEREHSGLRRIAGYGVTITRGAASAIMFTYSSLLVTMSRNILSFFRSSFVHKYFPFDEMVSIHKYISWWALAWTLIHIVGHAVNFYHISTQTASDLLCLFRNFHRSTHVLPKFHYWCWETVTGLTGVALTIQIAIIYVFAVKARKHMYQFFWLTHNSHPLLYALTILHGSGQLVQAPIFFYFFLGPCILFALDKIISASRKSIKIEVLQAEHLPSSVTLLRIRRPLNFSYFSGQWIRIASVAISKKEFHPFTLSSAPHEKDLTLHIRGVGPWTNSLRKFYPDYDTGKMGGIFSYPEVYIDGPFGEGHQMWWNYEVAVFVGGGIGVTPFASILKDITFKLKQPFTTTTLRSKKVIFLWVTRSQKQFEWMTDILRTVEEGDIKRVIKVHIFITQYKSKFDFRTMMMYLAEKRFRKLFGKSMFTGLKALTHFSRPDFKAVFKTVKERYTEVPIVGVFTCGSYALSSSVDAACHELNKDDIPVFKHFYENF